MNNQEIDSLLAVLEAALHNAKVIVNQLESLVNPDDDSFKDYDMSPTIKQVQEAVDAIEHEIGVLSAKKNN